MDECKHIRVDTDMMCISCHDRIDSVEGYIEISDPAIIGGTLYFNLPEHRKNQDMQCPFCLDTDFDMLGLKNHFHWCDVYNQIN